MKQVLQNLRTGHTVLVDVPCPRVRPGHLLIRTRVSLVSAGTERMLVEFGKASLLEKARQQPDRVWAVLDKVRTDGLLPTIETVLNRLDTPLPLGYCNAGVVIEVGAGVDGFAVGDRVVSNGHHAEVVSVPKNLCARIPGTVADEDAVFTVIGAIGLQGARLAQPTLGETIVVTGLGLIGLVTVQLLRAQGCRVLGIDYDAQRLAMARQFGAETVNLGQGEDPLAVAKTMTCGVGVDAVLITAATDSSEPVTQAAKMCRKRGRIVLVGVTGLELSRADFYEKELSFQVSCSYGPGRYDPAYEQAGHDYPIGLVRWTEQRNFEAVLGLMSEGQLELKPLVAHRFALQQAAKAYETLTSSRAALGIVLQYTADADRPTQALRESTVKLPTPVSPGISGTKVSVGFIGAGNYASAVLIPAFREAGARLRSIASTTGVTGVHAARRFGFEETTTDVEALLNDPAIDAVVIATRHDTHVKLVCQALEAGKHVFVEKPLAIDQAGLNRVRSTYLALAERTQPPLLMVGFNRRFAPHIVKIKTLLSSVRESKAFVMTVNAGSIPPDHWTQIPEIGGGRIIGEACHFIDLLRFLAAGPIRETHIVSTAHIPGATRVKDNVSISMTFGDGSIGTVHYLSGGHKSFPKERLEVFCGGRVLQLDNFRRLNGYGWPGFKRSRLWRQDKGNRACAAEFVRAIVSRETAPIAFEELAEVTELTFSITDQLVG
jgi:predicted dehydrogenase/threonine dehydrogenase-like Zn-dependent dehydrogenase